MDFSEAMGSKMYQLNPEDERLVSEVLNKKSYLVRKRHDETQNTKVLRKGNETKIINFASSLRDKYTQAGAERCYLFHRLVGGSVDTDIKIDMIDFPGKDSIVNFINLLYEENADKLPPLDQA